jgi:hypothetical protein
MSGDPAEQSGSAGTTTKRAVDAASPGTARTRERLGASAAGHE